MALHCTGSFNLQDLGFRVLVEGLGIRSLVTNYMSVFGLRAWGKGFTLGAGSRISTS